MEDWSKVDIIKQNWTETRIKMINKTQLGEYWMETYTGGTKLHLLVDTGNSRIFVSQTTANQLISKFGKVITKNTTQLGKCRSFNNNKIKIQGVVSINVTSGKSAAKNFEILVVPHNTVNLLGRDVLQKLRIHLSQKQKVEKTMNIQLNKGQQKTHNDVQKISARTYAPICTAKKPYNQIHIQTIIQTNTSQRTKSPTFFKSIKLKEN